MYIDFSLEITFYNSYLNFWIETKTINKTFEGKEILIYCIIFLQELVICVLPKREGRLSPISLVVTRGSEFFFIFLTLILYLRN